MPNEFIPVSGLNSPLTGTELAVFELRIRHCEDDSCHYCGKPVDSGSGYMFLDAQELACHNCLFVLKSFVNMRNMKLVLV